MLDFKKELANNINKITNIEIDELESYIEIPPNSSMGDYSFPCFKLAKTLKKSPNIIAENLKDQIKFDKNVFEEIKIVGGYLNFYINKKTLIREVFNEIDSKKENYGKSDLGKDKNIIIEYSSPNIAKPFHIGHLRNTLIGASLYNMYKFLGYNIERLNHLGDYGTQFGKLIEGYKRWGDEYSLEEEPIKDLMDIYVRINNLCKEDQSVLDKCRENFKLLEQGDKYCLDLWKKFRKVSLDEFQKIYDILNVEFDSLRGEAECAKDVDNVLETLGKKEILIESEGAKIVDLESKNLGVCMLCKSNGSSTYAARDLSAINYRANKYNFDKCLYVVGDEQKLHFKQIFEVAKYLDIPEKCKENLQHISYGMVKLPTGKMSTREGNVIEVQNLLDESIIRVKQIISEKNPELENIEENAKKIGIGAVKFNNLCTTLVKDQIFEWNSVLNFNGETGPYIQYTYVRTNSVLNKVQNIPNINNIDIDSLLDNESTNIVNKIYNYNNTVKNAVNCNEPSILARYLIDLSKLYSTFYNNNKIIVEDEKIKNARVYLTYITGIILKSGMNLLGIEMPEKM